MTEYISALVIPFILLILGLLLFSGKKNYFESFTEGAKEGLSVTVQLIPAMVLTMTALSMLSASGIIPFTAELAGGILGRIGVPVEILPLVLTRPFSGSGASASFAELLSEYGADSFPAFAASVLMGCGDTLFYIFSVYFSAAPHVKRTSYAIPVAIAAAIFSLFFSCFLARVFYC